jgi:hypothetical protein
VDKLLQSFFDVLEGRGEGSVSFRAQGSEWVGKQFLPFRAFCDTVAFDQGQTLAMAERMLLHALEQNILILLREPGEAKRAGGPDLSQSKICLAFGRQFLHQGDALGDPGLAMVEKVRDGRNRHAVIDHQGMGDAGFVQG